MTGAGVAARRQAADSAVQRLPWDSPPLAVERSVKQALARSCAAYNGRKPEARP